MADQTYYTQRDELLLPGQSPTETDLCIPRFHIIESLKDNDLIPIEMVEIITPGDRLSRPVQKVTDQHKRRWPREYKAFRDGLEVGAEGTPIATWQAISWSMQNELRMAGFQTIEQLAGAHDGQMASFPNGQVWRRKAQEFVKQNTKTVNMVSELEVMRGQMAAMQAQLDEANKGKGNVLSAPGARDVPRKRGRRSNADKARDNGGPAQTPGGVGEGEPQRNVA